MAVALRARMGLERWVVVSLEDRMRAMEEAKAVGLSALLAGSFALLLLGGLLEFDSVRLEEAARVALLSGSDCSSSSSSSSSEEYVSVASPSSSSSFSALPSSSPSPFSEAFSDPSSTSAKVWLGGVLIPALVGSTRETLPWSSDDSSEL